METWKSSTVGEVCTRKSILYVVPLCMGCQGHCNVLCKVYGVYAVGMQARTGRTSFLPSSWDDPLSTVAPSTSS